MKTKLILFILSIVLVAANACKKINEASTDPNLKLSFSVDTVMFDTVFTSLGSATHQLKIYNRHNDDLKISSIRLMGGISSPFRLNVDGENKVELHDKLIPANDSLYSFLRVTINPNDQNMPFVVEDELQFVTNGNIQTVKLLAWGQNANYIVGDKVTNAIQSGKYIIVADSLQMTVWTKERPYVVYGYALINSYGTLKIEAGTRIYCHKNSGIFSWSDGQLIIEGTSDEPVIIQGDRLEPYFRNRPGQWDQIMLMDGRAGADHRISHAIIRNGFIGINCQSALKVTECALRIDNTIIENQSAYGMYSILYPVEAKNILVANSGVANLWAFGGDYRFVHGTFANYWSANEHDNNKHSVVVLNRTVDKLTEEVFYYPFQMEMANCIIYGKQKNEFRTDFGPNADSTYLLDHCLVKSEKLNNSAAGFNQCIFNRDPLFANINGDFHIDSIASPVIGMGNPMYGNEVPYDLDGVSRIGTPDIGAYQFVWRQHGLPSE